MLDPFQRDAERLARLARGPGAGRPFGNPARSPRYQSNPGHPHRSNPHNPGSHAPYTCQELAGFRSIRSGVMTRVWEHVREREARGEVLTTQQFGALVEEEWRRAREAARACPTGVALEE